MHHKHNPSLLKLTLAATIIAFNACQQFTTTRQQKLLNTVDSFATAYYNWRFQQALPHVTTQSEKYLRYLASQVTQEDVNKINRQNHKATIQTININYQNDSIAIVNIAVNNHLHMGPLGQDAKPKEQAYTQLHLVFDDKEKRWKVNLNGPLREI